MKSKTKPLIICTVPIIKVKIKNPVTSSKGSNHKAGKIFFPKNSPKSKPAKIAPKPQAARIPEKLRIPSFFLIRIPKINPTVRRNKP